MKYSEWGALKWAVQKKFKLMETEIESENFTY